MKPYLRGYSVATKVTQNVDATIRGGCRGHVNGRTDIFSFLVPPDTFCDRANPFPLQTFYSQRPSLYITKTLK